MTSREKHESKAQLDKLVGFLLNIFPWKLKARVFNQQDCSSSKRSFQDNLRQGTKYSVSNIFIYVNSL